MNGSSCSVVDTGLVDSTGRGQEYAVGRILTLDISPVHDRDGTCQYPCQGGPDEFEIVDVFEPFTMAVVCVIRPTRPAENGGRAPTYLLKLHDRRYANNVRKIENPGIRDGTGPWTIDREALYQKYHSSEDRPAFDYDAHWDDPKPQGGFDVDVIFEHFASICAEDDFEMETKAYAAIVNAENYLDLPVPKYYGTVQYKSPFGPVRGLLMEHIDGSITLRRYLKCIAPCGYRDVELARVCDMVMKSFGKLDVGVPLMNDDLRLDNVLVQLGHGWNPPMALATEDPDKKYPTRSETEAILSAPCVIRVVFVDFAKVKLRYPDETDREWARVKEFSESTELWNHMRVAMLYGFRRKCPVHESACAPKEPRDPQTIVSQPENIWSVPMTSREIELSDIITGWGLYDYRDNWIGPHTNPADRRRLRNVQRKALRRKRQRDTAEALARLASSTDVAVPSDELAGLEFDEPPATVLDKAEV